MNAIETTALVCRYGSFTAVDKLSLSVEEGEVFGLLGPNGAGKSTTIKVLTTLLAPTSGRASIGGYDTVRQAARVRRVIGYVPQLISADGTLSGYENLLIFAQLYDIPKREREQRIRAALAFMGLEEAAAKLVRSYSGGMIRRLEIAQSMLHRPRVLFLDEPTIGLDPLARSIVWEHVQRLKEQFGMTIFLTTHLMEEADSLCNRVAIMSSGKVAAVGSPADLKESMKQTDATMDDVFIRYTSGRAESSGGFREATRTRRTARRLG